MFRTTKTAYPSDPRVIAYVIDLRSTNHLSKLIQFRLFNPSTVPTTVLDCFRTSVLNLNDIYYHLIPADQYRLFSPFNPSKTSFAPGRNSVLITWSYLNSWNCTLNGQFEGIPTIPLGSSLLSLNHDCFH